MTCPEQISLAVCQEIFPLLLCLDEQGCIVSQSERLTGFLDTDFSGQNFADAFMLDAPVGQYPDLTKFLAEHLGALLLFHTRDHSAALRGQLIRGWHEGEACHFLLCTPWLMWMREHLPQRPLDPLDFPVLDSQLDMEMSINMQKAMHRDLEELTDSLKQAKLDAEASSQAKSEFVSHVSHELRTPLNAISSATLLLNKRNRVREPEEQRLMEILSESTSTLMELINNVLDFSDLQRAGQEIRLSKFKPRTLLREVESIFAAISDERLCEIRYTIKESVPELVRSDALGLKKVLINLIGNALKHARSELIVVTMNLNESEHQDALVCQVRDFGLGMDEETISRLFEEFYIGERSTVGSSGLGMAITRKLVERLGGSISVESALNEGTCFKFIYPVSVENVSDDPVDDSAAQVSAAQGKGEPLAGHVLLVDDNGINLEVGSLLLQSLGLTVAVANSGKEAISRCRAEQFDLVFMDINMPGINGMDACREIRAYASCHELPIFALTANVSPDEDQRYRNSGMQEVLLKPLQMDVLAETAGRYLNGENTVRATGQDRNAIPGNQNTGSDQYRVLNMATLETMLGSVGADSARNLLKIFETAAAEIVHALSDALERGDLLASRNLAHKLASSALTYGLERLGHLLQKIEQSNDAELRNNAGPLIKSLAREHHDAQAALEENFADHELLTATA